MDNTHQPKNPAPPSNSTAHPDPVADPDPELDSWIYEQTVEEIEATISRIESGELDLAQVFNEFAAAVESLQACEAFLAGRQRQMDLLIETLKDEPEF